MNTIVTRSHFWAQGIRLFIGCIVTVCIGNTNHTGRSSNAICFFNDIYTQINQLTCDLPTAKPFAYYKPRLMDRYGMTSWLHWIDLLGVAVFAISGTLMAYKKHMDGFGVVVLASVTAIGGGTLRDMILDLPVFWVQDASYFYAIIIAAFLTIIWLRNKNTFPIRYLLCADAVGLAFFNMMGLQKALNYGASPLIAVALGTMTGVFGGLIRDVICREIPLVLKGELYATTCILGGAAYITANLAGLSTVSSMFIGGCLTLAVRLGAMQWHWHLPVFQPHDRVDE